VFQVIEATESDILPWLNLAKQVEPLFGPMINQDFDRVLRRNISRGSAFCVRSGMTPNILAGGLLFDYRNPPHYKLSWMAVETTLQRKGIGQLLLERAIAKTIPPCTIEVITFGPDHPGGEAARRFYEAFGFRPGMKCNPGPDGGDRQAFVLQVLASHTPPTDR
jgi:GNAT superfamily N-acetyltransferase